MSMPFRVLRVVIRGRGGIEQPMPDLLPFYRIAIVIVLWRNDVWR